MHHPMENLHPSLQMRLYLPLNRVSLYSGFLKAFPFKWKLKCYMPLSFWRCELGYFGRPFLEGGNCSSCQCNNNSDICDRESGSCLAHCENNSTGWHCERCENGTYGDATKQECRGKFNDLVCNRFITMKALVGHKLSYTVYYIRDGFTGGGGGGGGCAPPPPNYF